MTDTELRNLAIHLANDRSDGSQAGLNLLVERMRPVLLALASSYVHWKSCPCHYTAPCNDRCSCVDGLSSSGCRRCCLVGSLEQRQAKAARLASIVDRYCTQ